MSRRRPEAATGDSDSFLDVVANIVGILIILIVIAGVRVGQSTAVLAPVPTPAKIVEPTAPTPVIAPRPVVVTLPAPPDPPAQEPSPRLLAELDSTANAISNLENERGQLESELISLDAEVIEANEKIRLAVAACDGAAQELGQLEQASARAAAELDALRVALADAEQQRSDVPAKQVKTLRHTLNPIGREVRGDELHFRLDQGRVARVPVEQLVARLKPEVERHKQWIIKHQRHQGRVGPIDGFSMEFVVERQRLSVLDELRLGTHVVRIVVSGWKIIPETTLQAESIDEALHPDSKFFTALRLAPRGTTVTFWVYPDSFDMYRRLQEVVRAENFDVAARPLPHGVPIAGSPSGSRSSSQ